MGKKIKMTALLCFTLFSLFYSVLLCCPPFSSGTVGGRHKVGKKIKMTAGCQLFLHSGRDSQCEKAQIGLS